ncbi:MAG: phosphonate ABC transporter ATP-binding protein [Rhodobacteraceae bacterium]|jgi:phosphonate transport system ATP-binding protein|uniref:Phosphonate transport system ATP-binding protein n=1 Tax=Salipiger profundus TaxID=1229727 RepID=A0A1U7D488_9RHOB|nr:MULTISPECIES: ATP-binding cassette domain-containing protein [Salipiger]APX22971.1 phosphonate transport system ATP-binding protein [Salipiger profundus]MAB04637.1 phosphonate ABC transporter ATP-binding protein [Paracoccaceae bacterium]GGA12398.1 phosphonates import ATP-binding protein PhnC [Salipiger profundus]SFD22438.1 phosphonate transport system ATP-binding protein [Salipiger profundus]
MTLAVLQRETLGYGRTAVLPEVSFALAPGERVVLLGRSGAGKSTLLNAVHDRLAVSHRVALVPQDHALVPQLSVLRNVLMGRLDDHGAFYNLSNLLRVRAADRSGVAEVLAEVGLTDEIDRPVHALSGGQKQRVALARAWWRGGAVLIGDEPVSAVDETQAAALLDQARARFETALLALHDVGLARRIATRLVGLRRGGILFDAPADTVGDAEIAALYAR